MIFFKGTFIKQSTNVCNAPVRAEMKLPLMIPVTNYFETKPQLAVTPKLLPLALKDQE
jgi:hypothetical protein